MELIGKGFYFDTTQCVTLPITVIGSRLGTDATQ